MCVFEPARAQPGRSPLAAAHDRCGAPGGRQCSTFRTASKISTVDQHATPRVKEIRRSHKLDDYLPRRGPQRPRGAEWPLPGVESRLKELGFEWNGDFNNIEGAVRGARRRRPASPPRPPAARAPACSRPSPDHLPHVGGGARGPEAGGHACARPGVLAALPAQVLPQVHPQPAHALHVGGR